MIWEDFEPLTFEPLRWNDTEPWGRFGLPKNPPPEELPKDWKPCFVRFGGMPPGGRSYNWDASAYERGLGVFKAYETPQREPAEYVLDFEHMVGLAGTFFRIRNRPAYLARGREVARGGSNSPVLIEAQLEPLAQNTVVRPMVALPEWFERSILDQARREVRAWSDIWPDVF